MDSKTAEISDSDLKLMLATLFYYADRNNYALDTNTLSRKILTDYGEKARKAIDTIVT